MTDYSPIADILVSVTAFALFLVCLWAVTRYEDRHKH